MSLSVFTFATSENENEEQEQLVRVKVIEQKPWFCAKDVCAALELKNSRDAVVSLKSEQRATVGITDARQTRHVTFISESGLYKLIFKSRTKQAEAFQDWVCEEVLPQIRRSGQYSLPTTGTDDQWRINLAKDLLEHPAFKNDALMLHACRERLINAITDGSNSTEVYTDLTSVLDRSGYNQKQVEPFRVKIGIYLSNKYLEKNGRRPGKTNKLVNGAYRDVCFYTPDEWKEYVTGWAVEYLDREGIKPEKPALE
jgi:prophage antirepressor-like protein